MDTSRLANVIFDRGSKIPQGHYQSICESIEDDRFTMDEYVLEYKMKESFFGKVPFLLEDGSKILISPSIIKKLNSLNIDKMQLESYINKNYSSLNNLIEAMTNGDQ